MKLSDYLKQYRKENNLTQQDLANKLYVSKQAVSKWETERGLPDIETYKELSKLLGISIDELLGLDSNTKKEESKNNKSVLIIIFITILTLLLFVFAIIIIATNKNINKQDEYKDELISKVEEDLNLKLPNVKEYKYTDFSDWSISLNASLPKSMFYLIFDDEIKDLDMLWLSELTIDIINTIPVNLGDLPEECDYFKIIDLKTKQINKINMNDYEVHSYILYCYNISNKRLIAINFEV